MRFRTNVPAIEITDTGIIVPNEDDILQGVLADFNQAFGGNLNLNLDTPQGQLASSLTAIIADRDNQLARLMNQVNPDYADGIMQDAIAKIYFLERKKAVDSSVECEFIGLAGTIIPKGFAVSDTQGVQWILRDESSILEGGRGGGIFTAAGVVSAAANTVNRPVRTITGLDRVNNPRPAIPGRELESRADFRRRRQQSVAANAHGTPQSVYSNVAQLDGVSDVYVVDNPKSVSETHNGQTIKPHSIYVAVVGGDDRQIAETILRFAGCGCDFTGNTTLTVYDETYTDPKPAYEVSFTRPAPVPVYFRIRVGKEVGIGYQDVVRKAVIEAFDGAEKAGIGGRIYAMRYVCHIARALTSAQVIDIEVGLARGSMGNSAQVGIHQFPTITAENIEVVPDA